MKPKTYQIVLHKMSSEYNESPGMHKEQNLFVPARPVLSSLASWELRHQKLIVLNKFRAFN